MSAAFAEMNGRLDKGPPESIAPSDLWLALTQIPRPHKLVDIPRNLPGTDAAVGQVAMWPITQEEQMAANAAADRFTKQILSDPQKRDEANLGYEHTYGNETAVQILYRVCRDPNDIKRPAFPSPKQLRMTLTADEVGVLFREYLTVQLELGPIVAYMTPEEQEAWIRRIAEGGSAYPFELLSWENQKTLVLSMASQLVSCWTAMSSAGLPRDGSSTTPQTEPQEESPPSIPSPEENDTPSPVPQEMPSEDLRPKAEEQE